MMNRDMRWVVCTAVTVLLSIVLTTADVIQDFTGAALGAQTGTMLNDDLDVQRYDAQGNPNIQASGGVGDSAYLQLFGGYAVYRAAGQWYSVTSLNLSVGTEYNVSLYYEAVDVGTPDDGGTRSQDWLNVVVATDNGLVGYASRVDVDPFPMTGPGGSTIEFEENLGSNITATAWTEWTSTSTFSIDATDENVFIGYGFAGWGANVANPVDNFDYVGIDSVSINVIPEPSSILLSAFGLGLIAWRRRAKKRG